MASTEKTSRPTCPTCLQRPVAVNRHYKARIYYRKICDCCSRAQASGRRLRPQPPAWVKSGYKKKSQCEVCGFRLKLDSQSKVYYIDGDLSNNHWSNLRTVCANCQCELATKSITWRLADLVPDF